MLPNRIAPVLALLAALACGCEPSPVNRSPTPDQAPDRFARALIEADAVRRTNREAEAAFYRRARINPPVENSESNLSTPQPHAKEGQS